MLPVCLREHDRDLMLLSKFINLIYIYISVKGSTVMDKPYVICHMASTIDGRIVSANWGNKELAKQFSGFYEACHETFESQAWMLGRVSLEKDFSKGGKPELIAPEGTIKREPFIGSREAKSFAVAVDSKGKLGWRSNEIGGDHIIAVLVEEVSDEYLYYLQRKKISYIFAGKKELDLKSALHQLAELFPISTLMLEGGGHLNGSLLNEGLIDELSILLLPVADGTPNSPTVFEVSEYLHKNPATQFSLTEVQKLEHDVLWLKYKVRRS